MKSIFSYFLLFFVFIFGLAFASLNSYYVIFNYYFGIIKIGISLLLSIAFMFGFICGLTCSFFYYLKKIFKNKNKETQISKIDIDDNKIEK